MITSVQALLLVCIASGAMAQDLAWDYNDQASWGGICTTGENQTPIDINSMKVDYCPDWGYQMITIDCEEFLENIINDEFGQQNIGSAYLFYYHELANWYEAYSAQEIYWHTQSEHNINGQRFAAEMEIWFEAVTWTDIPAEARGIYADADLSEVENSAEIDGIIGTTVRFLFRLDQEAEVDIFDGLRTDGENIYWNLNTMFGCAFDKYFYAYPGSLSVPVPGSECKEVVWNYVSREPLPIKAATLATINEKINFEDDVAFRETQELNGRTVYLAGAPCPNFQPETQGDL